MTTNLDRSHNLLREAFFVVYHADCDLAEAFIARPLLDNDGKLTGWQDNTRRCRMAFADDQVTRLSGTPEDFYGRDTVPGFFDAEELFHV